MSSALTKRQQAKNERILQELVKVPGNDKCADCGTKNPAWASWSLGIFLCIRCASLHRKLGTHISKVKSISMDSWNNDQIDTMRKNGNIKSNAYFNPEPSKHPAPLDADDSDSDLERYIRAKYEYQHFRRSQTGQSSSVSSLSSGASTTSSFGMSVTPTGNSNGLSSASGSSSVSFPSAAPQRTARRTASQGFGASRVSAGVFRSSSPSNAKVSQILGTTAAPYTDRDVRRIPVDGTLSPSPTNLAFPHGMVRMSEAEKYDEQLRNLQDMGFRDVKKNLEVLASTNGKILETVEILVRLGKIGGDDKPAVPPKNGSDPFGGDSFGASVQKSGGAGISIQKTENTSSSNPWDIRQKEEEPLPPLPQTQTVATNGYGYNNPWNGQQNGNSYVQPQPQQQQNTASFQMNGLAQTLPNFSQQPQQMTNPYATPQQQQPQQQPSFSPNNTGYNPFMSSTSAPPQNLYQSPPPAAQPQNPNPYLQQFQPQTNPYQQQQQQQQNAYQQQQQQQQNSYHQQQNPYHQQQQQQPQFSNPYQQQQPQQNGYASSFSSPGTQSPYQQQPFFNPQQQRQQPLQYAHTGLNKNAILSLYSAPHLAPQPNPSPVQMQQQSAQSAPVTPSVGSAGSNNPFAKAPNGMNGNGVVSPPAATGIMAGRGAGAGPGGRHMSQESVDFGAWQSGRHSPDAFASLAFGGR